MKPYYESESVTLYHQTAMDTVRGLEDNSINCVVTSPPYWNLRDYGEPNQWGTEPTIGQYVDHLVNLFGALERKLTHDGTVWLNLGDKRIDGELCGIPWMVAKAIQTDGWKLRSAIVWHKPNGMPESCTDRVSSNYEMLFMLARSTDHYFNLDPLRVEYDGDRSPSRRARTGHTNKANSAKGKWAGSHDGRNPGSVWSVPTQPWPGAHEAVMPLELAKRCILAGCPPGGVTLDPFHGSGTTGQAAVMLGARYIGADINSEYLDLSLRSKLSNHPLPIDLKGGF